MSDIVEIVDARLVTLADDANREHEAVAAHVHAALAHAIAAGEFLLQARELVPRGQWEAWVYKNFRAPRMSRPYMRLAKYKHLLPPDVEFTLASEPVQPPVTGSLGDAQQQLLRTSEMLRDLVRREGHPEARRGMVDALTRLALIDDILAEIGRLSTLGVAA